MDINFINQILTSPTTEVVLMLLLIFQWYKQHAKEQSIKNNLFSIRRVIGRILELKLESKNGQIIKQKAEDLTDSLDATLATLDARIPFTIKLYEVLDLVKNRFRRSSSEELRKLPNEVDEKKLFISDKNK